VVTGVALNRRQAFDQTRILQAMDSLPEAYRCTLDLVDLRGLRYAEAARELGCPIGTIMSRLHRGRRMLHSRLRAAATA
jgi:RNA polymerase sigma-70 factor, ECF subfamily